MYFTKAEAQRFVGKTVKTNGGKATITGIFPEGPNHYSLVDDKGGFIYKSHRNCPYVIE
jgi:hypothetical protein